MDNELRIKEFNKKLEKLGIKAHQIENGVVLANPGGIPTKREQSSLEAELRQIVKESAPQGEKANMNDYQIFFVDKTNQYWWQEGFPAKRVKAHYIN